MEFKEATQRMEQGRIIKRGNWAGYLFMDCGGNIRHAGKMTEEEETWELDVFEKDWEEAMANKSMDEEMTKATLEGLMDQSASNIKRLYFLEEMIEGQHKALKKLTESVTDEMNETRQALSVIVKSLPLIKESLKLIDTDLKATKKQSDDIKKIKESMAEMEKNIFKITKKSEKPKVEEAPKKKSIKKEEEKGN